MATKRCFCRFIGEIFRYECWFMKLCVCVWSWKLFLIIFVVFVNEEVCEIFLITSSCTDYEFSAAILIFKVLMWNVYYYHEILTDIDRQENYKRLVVYGFHSWQINWHLTPRREKLFMKTSIATSNLFLILFWS